MNWPATSRANSFHQRQQLLGGRSVASVRVELQVFFQVLPRGRLLVQAELRHAEPEVGEGKFRLRLRGLRQVLFGLFQILLVVGVDPLVVQDLWGVRIRVRIFLLPFAGRL